MQLIISFPVLIVFLLGHQVDALARLIRVPLSRTITQGAGAYGQPVVSYHTLLSVGTPPKSFKIQFDIDTSESFVPHYSWNPFNRNLHYSDGFKCKSSSTCVRSNTEFTVEYQHVKLIGKRYEDVLSLSMVYLNETTTPMANASSMLTRQAPTWRQNFLAIASASDSRFSSLPVDGFFGLGPAAKSHSGVQNMLACLHSANLIDNLQFSLWYNPTLDSMSGGEIMLGGVDVDRYHGQIYWHHLSAFSPHEWSLNLQSVSVGNQVIACAGPNLPVGGCTAKFSTGLSDIYGPREDVAKIYSLLNSTKSSSGLELIDCRRIQSLPYITFYIDGISYHLLPSNFIRKTIDGSIFKDTCYVAILPNVDSAHKTWTLASPFLGAYYSIFDLTYRQIGFATVK